MKTKYLKSPACCQSLLNQIRPPAPPPAPATGVPKPPNSTQGGYNLKVFKSFLNIRRIEIVKHLYSCNASLEKNKMSQKKD